MTWKSFHSRGEILRAVIAAADARRDGELPWDVEGVAETFEDELALLGALQLRWHTRLAGRIERELTRRPMDLEGGVVAAWQATADEMPGVLAIVDHHRAEPTDAAMAEAMAKSAAKERIMLAMMAGRASGPGATAARAGAALEARARSSYRPSAERRETDRRSTRRPTNRRATPPRLLARLKAALAA